MKIQAVNFSRNGANKFEGLLKVVHDDDRPTHFSRKVDVYDGAKLEKFLNEATALFPTNDEARAELHRIIQNLEVAAKTAEALPDEEAESNRSQASRLVDLAQGAEVWHTPDGATFATVDVDGHRESQALRSRGFKEWLAYTFYQVEGKSPGGQAVADAIATLSGKAIFDGPEYPVFTRVAEVDGTIYIDLANAGWETIKVTSSGWTITKDAPVRFRRPRGMLSLPYPVPGGNLGLLRDLLNLESDNDWALYVSCVAQALRGRGPYPVLVLYGEHGSAKSTAARVYRRILDPNKADLRSPPRNEHDLRIQATNGWVVAYDNLSSIQEWLANALCRVSTGGGMSTRELYSDDDEVLFEGQRPIVLNGIEEISTRADLIDRSVILLLQPIPPEARRTERQFWDDFAVIHPQILGGLLDAVAMGLREEATTTISVLPRMADFAVWATAAEPGLGLERGAFMRAYDLNRAGANDSAIMGALIGPYVVQVVETTACGWSGTATELLTALNGIAPENVQKDKQWPKAANSLSGKLRAIAPNLRAAWIEVVQESSQGRGHSKISLTFKNESGNHRRDRRTAERAGVTGGDVGDVGDDFPSYSNEPAFFDSGESPPCAICKTPLAVEDINTYDDAGDPLCFGCSVNEGVAPNFL